MSVGNISLRRTPQELHPDDAGPSWQSRCINGLLQLLSVKKQTASVASFSYIR